MRLISFDPCARTHRFYFLAFMSICVIADLVTSFVYPAYLLHVSITYLYTLYRYRPSRTFLWGVLDREYFRTL